MTAVEEQNVSAGEAENSAKVLRSDLLELFDRCKLNLPPAQFFKGRTIFARKRGFVSNIEL